LGMARQGLGRVVLGEPREVYLVWSLGDGGLGGGGGGGVA
jgi:hypothetical protein